MSGVQAVGTPAAVAPTPAASTADGATALLPDAATPSAASMSDAMSALYVAISNLSQNATRAGASEVESDQRASQKALEDQQAALQRQQDNDATHGRGFFSSIGHLLGDEAHDVVHLHVEQAGKDAVGDAEEAWKSPAFWNDLEKGALVVAKVAAAVGSAVVTAASFGAGAATIAGAALLLSVGGEVVSDTQCFGKASAYVAVGLDVAGALTGGVGAATAAGATVASKTAMTVGASVSALGGEAQAVAGGAHIRTQDFAANVQEAGADAQQAIDEGEQVQQLAGWVIDDLKASHKTSTGTLQALQGAMQANDQSNAAAAASISLKG
jgi:hypothetical protein